MAILARTFANLGQLALGGAVAAAAGLGAILLAARLLGGTGWGILALAQAAVLLVAGLLRPNAAPVFLRRAAVPLARGDGPALCGLLARFAALELGAAAVAVLVLELVVVPLWPRLGGEVGVAALLVWYAPTALFVQTAIPLALLRLLGRFDLVGAARVVVPAVRLAGVVALPAGSGVGAVAAVWLAAHALDLVVVWGLALRELARRRLLVRPAGAAGREGRILGRELLAVHLTGTLGLVASRLATLVVGALLGAAEAGLFQLALQFAGILDRAGEMLRRALEPELGRLAAAGDCRRGRRLAGRSLALAGLAAALPLLAALIHADDLLALAGAAFARGGDLLRLLLLRQLLAVAATVVAAVLVVERRAGRLLRASALARLGHLLLLPPLILTAGVEGAGLAALLATLAELLLLVRALAAAPPPPRPGTF